MNLTWKANAVTERPDGKRTVQCLYSGASQKQAVLVANEITRVVSAVLFVDVVYSSPSGERLYGRYRRWTVDEREPVSE